MVDFEKLNQKARLERGLKSLCQGFYKPDDCPVCQGRGCKVLDDEEPKKTRRGGYDYPGAPERPARKPRGGGDREPVEFHDEPPSDIDEPEDGEEATVEGKVDRIVAEREGWMAGKLHRKDGTPKMVSFSGNVGGLQVGSSVKLTGVWETHPKYGRQFKAKLCEVGLPTDAEGFVELLMRDEAFKGIGPVRARSIVTAVESQGWILEDALKDVNKRAWLATASKVPVKTIELLAEKWKENAASNKAKAKLLSFGISANAMEKLSGRFGSAAGALEKIQDDPYFLFREVDGFGFQSADEVAQRMGVKRTAEVRLRAGVLEAIERSLQDGHTWTPRGEVMSDAYKVLGLHETRERDKLKEAMRDVSTLGAGDIQAFDHENERALGRSSVIEAERKLLAGFTPGPSSFRFLHGTPEKLAAFEPLLNEKQQAAVIAAMSSNRLAIVGAAGCGKTFTIGTIVRVAEASGLRVSVCAPTGKAAKRLEEVFAKQGMQRPASTVHRLLAYGYVKGQGVGFQHNKLNPLPADIVICDEASMLDVRLAWHLIDALQPTATLILVGDEEQIPPVGPGAVLRDLVKTNLCPVLRLVDVVRQAGELRVNSLKLLKGKLAATAEIDKTIGAAPWVIVDDKRKDVDVLETVLMLFERRLEKMGAEALSRIQIISPQRKGKVGVENLNVELQKLVQDVLYNVDVPEKGNTQLLVGDKVMQTRNDYDLDIMNGDQGVVVSRTEKDVVVEFGTSVSKRNVVIPRASAGALVLAYAITVHKAQGSEWDFIICVCHKSHQFMWHRNLLYTAVTRSSLATCVIGDERMLSRAVKQVDAQDRRTLLSAAKKTDFEPKLNPVLEKAPPILVQCPLCGNLNDQGMLCTACGESEAATTREENRDDRPPECENCGMFIRSVLAVCGACGFNPNERTGMASSDPLYGRGRKDPPAASPAPDEDLPF